MTTACIAVQDDHGFRAMAIANDGHLEGTGRMLFDHYGDSWKIDALMKLRAARSLQQDPDTMLVLEEAPGLDTIEEAYRHDFDHYYVRYEGQWIWRTTSTSWFELGYGLFDSQDVNPDDPLSVPIGSPYRIR